MIEPIPIAMILNIHIRWHISNEHTPSRVTYCKGYFRIHQHRLWRNSTTMKDWNFVWSYLDGVTPIRFFNVMYPNNARIADTNWTTMRMRVLRCDFNFLRYKQRRDGFHGNDHISSQTSSVMTSERNEEMSKKLFRTNLTD